MKRKTAFYLFVILSLAAAFAVFRSEFFVQETAAESTIPFDPVLWQEKDGLDYIHRNTMIDDVIESRMLKRLNEKEVKDVLGPPDRSDGNYLFYQIAQKRAAFFPLHTKTLVVHLSTDTSANKVMIHE